MIPNVSSLPVVIATIAPRLNKYKTFEMHRFASYRTLISSLVICLNFLRVVAITKDVLEFSLPSKCKNNEYFDSDSLSCVECDLNKNLVPSGDRLRCVCNERSKSNDFKNGHPVCTFCSPNATVTVDGKDCISCTKGTCKCSANQVQIDRYLNGTLLDAMYCLSCPNDSYPSMDGSKCLLCNSSAYSRHENCACPAVTHVRVLNHCLYKDDLSDWLDVRSTYLVKFGSNSIDSYYFRSKLQTAMYFCKRRDKLACQHLANMCALTLYANGVPCMLFMQTHITPVWLFYNKDETMATLNNKQITQRYSLFKNNDNGTLNFTIATFSLEGNLQRIGKSHIPCDLLKYIRFGINLHRKCKLPIQELLNSKIEFLSPYLMFVENDKVLMHALPVLIKNINENAADISHSQLVRKFFLVDNVSGYKTLPGFVNGSFKKDSNLSVLRYMKSLNILINVQGGEDRGKIHSPLLIVEYAELTSEEIIDEAEVTLDYSVTFTLRDSNIDYNLQIVIGTLSGVALIFSGIKTWSYCKRNYTYIPSITVLFWFLIYAMGAVGNTIILSLTSLCIYLFVFYKGQTVPYVLLPNDTNERNIRIYTAVAFCFKLAEMIGFIYQYWDVNIFFMDWEQPRRMHNQYSYDSPHTSLRKLYSNRFSEDQHMALQTPSEKIAARRKKTPRKSDEDDTPKHLSKSLAYDLCETKFSSICTVQGQYSAHEINEHDNMYNCPVSIWRTYFVANQWLKLQTKRKISIILQSIAILFIFQIMELYSLSPAVPDLTSPEYAKEEKNFTLYYAVCTLIYILTYSTQWLMSMTFYERYIKNHMQEFVDLCSIANISVFILPFNYYGFYIHGRSVHGFADTDLPTLIKDLRKEENNLCAHRGLVPGTTEQTFVLSLTETFKRTFDDVSRQKNTGATKFSNTDRSQSAQWDQIFDSRMKLRQLLCEFVDHCCKIDDYIIKEQLFLEKLWDILFSSAKDKSVFYIDNNHSFDQVLFYGNEWLLATFEITVFAFTIALYEDCILATIVTVLISMLLIIITKCHGKNNLSNKALLDRRFLI